MSNLDEYRKSKKEMMEAQKQKYGISDIDLTKIDVHIPTSNGLKKTIENCWYHYKWPILIILLLAIFIFGFIYSILNKPVYDASLSIISKTDYFYAHDDMSQVFSQYLTDYSNDGKINLNLQTFFIDPLGNNNINPSVLMANSAKLMGTINTASSFLYILDEESYNFLVKQGVVFLDISDITNNKYSGQKYYLNDTNIIKNNNLSFLSDKFFCILDLNSYDTYSNDIKKIELFDNETNFFYNIIYNKQ